jgi:hypothetical protein
MTGFGPFDLNEMSDVVSQTKGREPDESTLIRYLVGRASDEEAEQLDELSVASEEFALRLRAVEHDLMDAYVNGELTGETLDGFRSQYLRTPSGLADVALAEALRGYRRTPAAARVAASVAAPVATPVAARRKWPAWGLAAAALVLAASAYLMMDDVRLRRQISGARETHAALEQRAQQLQEELNRQQSAARATEQELARAREALAAAPERAGAGAGVGAGAGAGDEPRTGGILLALVLSAARRGGDELPQFSIPPGADTVILRLPLVAVDFPHYEATLREATSDRIIWRSARLPAPAARERPMIPVTIRTSLLAPRGYTLELTGISARGQAEPLDSYLFKVVP